MKHKIMVRYARKKDAPALAAFNIDMAYETEGKRLAPAVVGEGVRRLLTTKRNGFYLVAEVDGVIAGSLMITFEWSDWRDGMFWWIQSVYVLPRFRRMGVYRALHGRVKAMAKKDPMVCGIRLYADRRNRRASDTYMNMGMRKTGYYLFEEEFARIR